MTEATPLPRRAGTGQARLELPITRESLGGHSGRGVGSPRAVRAPPRRRAVHRHFTKSLAAQIGSMLRPISTPLIMGGFEPETVDLVSGAFRDAGFTPMVSGMTAGSQPAAPAGPLREGDAIGVALASGDIDMGATGTITHIDGDRIYAFGHPFYNLGPAAVPDDAGLRLHDPAQPDVVLQDRDDGRNDRHDDSRIARRRSRARSAKARRSCR